MRGAAQRGRNEQAKAALRSIAQAYFVQLMRWPPLCGIGVATPPSRYAAVRAPATPNPYLVSSWRPWVLPGKWITASNSNPDVSVAEKQKSRPDIRTTPDIPTDTPLFRGAHLWASPALTAKELAS